MHQASYKVLCVCLGNICRSPTAEVILRTEAAAAGLDVMVDSAGTANYHLGEAPDSRSQFYAKQHGYDLAQLTARQVQLEDFQQFDLLLAMDINNLRQLQRLQQRAMQAFKTEQLRASLALMSAHDPDYPQQDVPDPYYGEAADFNRVILQCRSSSRAWVQCWQTQFGRAKPV